MTRGNQKHTQYDLVQMQSLPLSAKIVMTQRRVREWYEHYDGDVYVSFSGGKDSTVLLALVREMYPDVEAVFVDTGLEYPEIRQFVKTFDNVTILRPKMRFDEVIKKYGYPILGKEISDKVDRARKGQPCAVRAIRGELVDPDGNKSLYNIEKYEPLLNTDFYISANCCTVMKKKPAHEFTKMQGKQPITAQMAAESRLRTQKWRQNGCNGFEMKRPISNPMSFWTEQDIYQYIKRYNIPICSVYGDIVEADALDYYNGEQLEQMKMFTTNAPLTTTGCDRTGCIFCAYGCHLEKEPSRFQRLQKTHPRQYEYCLGGGEYNAEGIWQPNQQGLGMKHVFDELNRLYGASFIKY